LTAANTAGDVVVIQYNGVPSTDSALSADTSYSTAASVSIISASADNTGTAYTPTAMGTNHWIGNDTTNRFITFNSGTDRKLYFYGLTFRNAGTGDKNLSLIGSEGCVTVIENCYLWLGNSGSSSRINIGNTGNNNFSILKNCTFRFGAASHVCNILNRSEFHELTISSSGTAPSNLFSVSANSVRISGSDLSYVTSTLVANGTYPSLLTLDRCKIGSGVTVLAAQTSNPTRTSSSCLLLDCSSGDTHGIFGFYDALGSVVSDTGIYFTAGAAVQSWKIVTTANASFYHPFVTPPIEWYHSGTSAITPYLEILRNGSSIAYQDDEVWAEFAAKVTASSTQATFYSDRKSINPTISADDQTTGAGKTSWSEASGDPFDEGDTAWSGKIDSGTSFTPAEAGHITAQVCVGEPSITVYVDPQIRT
jgi:hypothetical protein